MSVLPRTKNLVVVPQRAADARESLWIERRARVRFRLVFPVVFHWNDGIGHSAVGYCRNIGLGGIFIVTSSCPPIDIEIEINVVVPAFNPEPRELLFRHTGRVIRIKACEDLLGFAVAGQFEHDNAIQEGVSARAFGQQ